jgi:filamentous hemagglutinin family protein
MPPFSTSWPLTFPPLAAARPARQPGRRRRPSRPGWLARAATLCALAFGAPAGAQIVTDGSVGAARVIGSVNGVTTIGQDLGRLAGRNLFHSFREFNVGSGQTALFTTTTPGLANVISRVTGGNPTQIFGTVRLTADGAPNFFLLNPAGVLFGNGASIDVPGAFHVSTADYIAFPDGRWHADPARGSNFSTAAPEAFGFLGSSRAPVVADGALLVTRAGRPLSLSGGDVLLTGASELRTGGAEIRLAAVGAGPATVPLAGDLPALAGQLVMDRAATVTAVGDGAVGAAGALRVSAGALSLDRGAYLYSEQRSTAVGQAGIVDVQVAGALRLGGVASISAYSLGNGRSANLKVQARELTMDGASYLYTNAGIGVGSAGTLDVTVAGAALLSEGSSVSTFSGTPSNGGGVRFRAGALSLRSGAYVSTLSSGAGSGGSTVLDIDAVLDLDGRSRVYSATTAAGPSGDVRIAAGSLRLAGKSDISSLSEASSSGQVGTVDIVVRGGASVVGDSRVSAIGAGQGGPGSVRLSADSLLLDFSSISSNSAGLVGTPGRIDLVIAGALRLQNQSTVDTSAPPGAGTGGTIRVQAAAVSLDGASQITSNASEGATGGAGDIDVVAAGRVELLNGSGLRSTTNTRGAGGRIGLVAGSLLLDGSAVITTLAGQASSGRGGDIVLRVAGNLVVRGGSSINALTGGRGDAGTVRLDVGTLTLQGTGPSDNQTNINSTTVGPGNAGRVEVNAADSVVLSGAAFITSSTFSSGNGGEVAVTAGRTVSLREAALLASSTSGGGSAGGVQVIARDLILDSEAAISSSAISGSTGNGGRARLQIANNVSVSGNASIQSITFGAGAAGSLTVEAGNITVTGQRSSISAAASEGSSGQVGNVALQASGLVRVADGAKVLISNSATVGDARVRTPTSLSIDARQVELSDAVLSASSTGNVAASDVLLRAAETVVVDRLGNILTTAVNGNGGAIRVDAGNRLTLRRSTVQTSVFGLTGNGGDITLRAPILLLDTGFVQANTAAARASGGLVVVDSRALIASGNTLFLGGNTPYTPAALFGFNVIQAAAPTGVSGVIDLTSPVLDLTGSLRALRGEVVDPGGLGRALCQTSGGSSFALAGRGGLPPSSRSLARVDLPPAPARTAEAEPAAWLAWQPGAAGPGALRGCL